jgi:hypothetical protein
VQFDHDTAKKALRDEVTLTLRLQRPKVARAQLIPLSVNGQGMLGRLHVRCVWRTRVGGPWEAPWGIEDPEASVSKLGFPSLTEFRRAWIEANDPGWVARGHVDEGARFERFQTRWRDRACWAVSFRVARDVPLLLAPSGSPPKRSEVDHGVDSPGDHGYVMSPFLALPDEPEAVDEITLARFQREAEQRRHLGSIDRQAEWEALSLEQKLSEALRLASEKGIDTSRQEASIRQRIESLRKKAQRAA